MAVANTTDVGVGLPLPPLPLVGVAEAAPPLTLVGVTEGEPPLPVGVAVALSSLPVGVGVLVAASSPLLVGGGALPGVPLPGGVGAPVPARVGVPAGWPPSSPPESTIVGLL